MNVLDQTPPGKGITSEPASQFLGWAKVTLDLGMKFKQAEKLPETNSKFTPKNGGFQWVNFQGQTCC